MNLQQIRLTAVWRNVKEAKRLLQDSSALTKVRLNGQIQKYNQTNNTFGAFTKKGVLKTLFKSKDSSHYRKNL